MNNILNSKAGQATPAKTPDTFFNQYFLVPNRLNPSEVTAHLLPLSGIPMRDYFAAKIITGLCYDYENGYDVFSRMAADAYRLADEMLKARALPDRVSHDGLKKDSDFIPE